METIRKRCKERDIWIDAAHDNDCDCDAHDNDNDGDDYDDDYDDNDNYQCQKDAGNKTE